MNVNEQNPKREPIASSSKQRRAGWSGAVEQGGGAGRWSRGDARHNSHSSIHGNCVSPTTRTGGPFISSSGSGRDGGK